MLQYNRDMYFYEVLVRSNHYHGKHALSYASEQQIEPGSIVTVPLRHETVIAVVLKTIGSPTIKTKQILSVLELPPLPKSSLKLIMWLKDYYPAPVGILTQQFLPAGLISLKQFPQPIDRVNPSSTNKLPKLTDEQTLAYAQMKENNTFLLHGRTGSGKTRLYLELAQDSLNEGRSVIILTPEISLTTQLEKEFRAVFGQRVVVIHSQLTPKQRAERWVSLLINRQPMIVIGPRSVIFSPLKDIGLIVIDEEHEPAYKQEQAPYYVTGRVAAQLRSISNAKLVLGSATPLVSDYYLATMRHKPIIRLSSLAKETTRTQLVTSVIDCRERSLFNRSTYISQPLIEAIESSLQSSNQTLLYLNRRGTARVIICDQCDWQAKCPRCDLPLTYHGDNHTLRCHVCGFSTSGPTSCPKCHNPSIKYLTIGTKAVVDEVTRLFPTSTVARFDADNLKADRLDQNYEAINNGGIDIIVGTQLLAKGLDLPKLSVVGVLLADTSLQLPDFTANERTYELLQQVIGRVGRGHVLGHALIQTYQPDNPVILNALADNWEGFYAEEIKERADYRFPPFVYMLKLTVSRANTKNAEQAATKLALSLPKQLTIEGPAPAFHEKQGNKSHWQLVIKATSRSYLLKIIDDLPANWSYDIDPSDLI